MRPRFGDGIKSGAAFADANVLVFGLPLDVSFVEQVQPCKDET
jgi:hypothetical protein